MTENSNDALTAAREWLREWGLCPHDIGLDVVCASCVASLAAVIDRVAESRIAPVESPAVNPAEPLTESDRLRAECDRLIARMHGSLEVAMDCQDGEPEENTIAVLSAIRIALLRLAYDYFGDPEAEETLAREGHAT